MKSDHPPCESATVLSSSVVTVGGHIRSLGLVHYCRVHLTSNTLKIGDRVGMTKLLKANKPRINVQLATYTDLWRHEERSET
jgi:hypothetical protein